MRQFTLSGGSEIRDFHFLYTVVNFDYKLLYSKKAIEFIEVADTALPVIRVFGSTDKGQRICVHIHGVMPYVYFRPENMSNVTFESEYKVKKFMDGMENTLDELLHTVRDAKSNSAGVENGEYRRRKRRHIHCLEVVRKTSLYGMYTEPQLFIKATLRDPADMARLATVLEEVPVHGVNMQAYEAHIPYLLKFTSDLNISPMGWMHLSQVKFRSPLPPDKPRFPPPNMGTDCEDCGDTSEVPSADQLVATETETLLTPDVSAYVEASDAPSLFESPSKAGAATQLFLTAKSPPKQIPRELSNNSHDSSATDSSGGLPIQQSAPRGLFTQSTVPASCIWGAESLGPNPENATHSLGNQEGGEMSAAEIAALLEGITEDTMVWSQYPEANEQSRGAGHEVSRDADVELGAEDHLFLQKESCCELEIDVHVSHIQNTTMRRTTFGAELWEEERLRCEEEGLPMDDPPAGPFTQTVHRTRQPSELGFIDRYHNLAAKGRALRRVGQEMSDNQPQFIGDCALSQFISSGRDDSLDSLESAVLLSHSDLGTTARTGGWRANIEPAMVDGRSQLSELSLRSWASQRIKEAEEAVTLESQTGEAVTYVAAAENSALEMFLASQQSSQQDASAGESDVPRQAMYSIGIAAVDDEDEEGASLREVEDIFTSTQAEVLLERHGAIAEVRSLSVVHERSSTVEEVNDYSVAMKQPWADLEPRHTEQQGEASFKAVSSTRPPLPPKPSTTSRPVRQASSNTFESPSRPVALPSQFSFDSPAGNEPPSATVDVEQRREHISSRDLQGQRLSSAFGKKRRLSSPVLRFAEDRITSGERTLTPAAVSGRRDENPNSESSSKKRLRRSVSFRDQLIEGPSMPGPSGAEPQLLVSAKRACCGPEVDNHLRLVQEVHSPPASTSVATRHRCVIPDVHTTLLGDLRKDSSISLAKVVYLVPTFLPPGRHNCLSLSTYGLPEVVHQPAYYSVPSDTALVTVNASSTALLALRHPVKHLHDLPAFDGGFPAPEAVHTAREELGLVPSIAPHCLIPTFHPPHPRSITAHSIYNASQAGRKMDKSQICSPTQTAHTPFSESDPKLNVGDAAISVKRMSRLTVLSAELHCNTRSSLLPNPKYDEVQVVCWTVDDLVTSADSEVRRRVHGIICQEWDGTQEEVTVRFHGAKPAEAADKETPTKSHWEERVQRQKLLLASYGLPSATHMHVVRNERELLGAFVNTVHNIDPDFLVGYELQSSSIGYLVQRGKVIGLDMLQALSKMQSERPSFRNDMDADLIDGHESKLFVTGRLVINMWHRMRDELKLFNYTYSNVTAHLLGKRVPYFTHAQLTKWYRHSNSRGRTVRHVQRLSELNLTLMDRVDLVRKTSESARLYGIDFFSVLSRGSQYRVEAALLTKAHALNFLLVSPSRRKVASQAPMECIPLVMEPRSQLYVDPVVILDYQSLYPSMMLAHNLCFSTCFGKLRPGDSDGSETTEKLGVTSYSELQSAMCATLHSAADPPYVSPNGSVFCSKDVRLGVLPQMVQEMLQTRVMVKRAMKRHKGRKGAHVLNKVLDARQLAIKLLSNVTYGYAAAGFSGRMPMAELADAIVQSGRSTLEWTAHLINSHPTWGGRVVYGDTDSVFVELKGRSREEAFRIGQEISDVISAKCPADVLLKFEKVYLPSVLVTKKRYVGYSYESVAQQQPHFDAKGIEVVRRDQCLATVKMQEKCLRLLFETRDMSRVKEYLYAQWGKMLQGGDRLLLRDFVFSKEVRLGHYASLSSQPPGAIVATKALLVDEMASPPYNWRVPYVVVSGVPNAPLKHLVYAPEELMRRGSPLRLNYLYYISKCINPALDRVLSLCGADVFAWFGAMARPKIRLRHINYDAMASDSEQLMPSLVRTKQTSMDQFTVQGSCTVCGKDAQPQKTLCASCTSSQMSSISVLMSRLNLTAELDRQLAVVCQNCSKVAQPCSLYVKGEITGADCCQSLDCQVFFERAKLVVRQEDYRTAVMEIEESP